MQPCTLLCASMLYVMFYGTSSYFLATRYACLTPVFDRRRCYQLYLGLSLLSWGDASTACKDSEQRLASMENEKLVKFVSDNIRFSVVWIGLSRSSDGQPDKWTSGQRLDATLYPGVTLNVSRGFQDFGLLCAVATKDSNIALANQNCRNVHDWICETFKSNIFRIKTVGENVTDVSVGWSVGPGVISVIDCIRKCLYDWVCQAISHDGVTCKKHFQHVGHNVTVTPRTVAYKRSN